MMTIGDKIRKARNDKKLTQVQLAEISGIPRGRIALYETEVTIPPVKALKQIADACNVPMTFFFEDSSEANKQIIKKELKANPIPYLDYMPERLINKNIVYIDKVDILAGAGAEGACDLETFGSDTKIGIDKSFLKGLNPANLKLFEVVGDSMSPAYDEGDLCIVDMVNHRYDFVKIGGIYIIRVGDIIYIKRVEFLPNNELKLISLNPSYGNIYPHKDGYEYEIIGKVCGRITCEIQIGLTFNKQGIG